MPTQQTKLTEADIRQVIADRYKTKPNDVVLTIHAGYDGGPTDRQAPSVSAVVTHTVIDEERERLIDMLMTMNEIGRSYAETRVDSYLAAKLAKPKQR